MRTHSSTIKSFLPLILLLILMAIGYTIVYFFPISRENLINLNDGMISFKNDHPNASPLLFMMLYILFALLSLPGIFILALLAGYLFPQPWSTIYVVCAATIGAALLYATLRTASGSFFFRKNSSVLNKMRNGFHENAASYLLFLRLIPLFPFAIVNIAGAYFNVPLKTFLWTTFIGMIPSVLIYTLAGRGLLEIVSMQEPISAAHFLNPQLVVGLGGLALLALLPVVFKHFRHTQ